MIPSTKQLLQIPLLGSLIQDNVFQPSQVSLESACDPSGVSCPLKDPSQIDACCLEYPSGHFLATQFWDTSPPLGPDDSWTIHGLWPDYCTGGFDAFCDNTRTKSPEELTAILSSAAKSTHPELLGYMTRYWLSNDHRNSNLWSHEWNKHGTCISTLEPKCYPQKTADETRSNEDILDYFTQATTLFASLNTHELLQNHDVSPSHTRTYTLSQLESAVESSEHGQKVTFRCNSRHELDEIWYHFLIRGSLRNASSADTHNVFVPTAPDGQISNCPQTGIRYLPKSSDPNQPTHTAPGSRPTSTSAPFTGRGHLNIHILPDSSLQQSDDHQQAQLSTSTSQQGCLIRSGTWYNSGTCATYIAKADVIDQDEQQLFTLQSSYAPCAVLEADGKYGKKGQFVCGKTLPVQSVFSASDGEESDPTQSDAKVLSYKGKTNFYADRIPGRFEKVAIFTDDGEGSRTVEVEVHWEST